MVTLDKNPLQKYLKAADGSDSCADFGGSSWWFFESLCIFTHAKWDDAPNAGLGGVRVPLGLDAGLEENMKSVVTRT